MSTNDSDITSEFSDFPLTPDSNTSIRGLTKDLIKANSRVDPSIDELLDKLNNFNTHHEPKKEVPIDPLKNHIDLFSKEELKFLRSHLEGEKQFDNLVCCGIHIKNVLQMVEHYEEFHAPARDSEGNLITYTAQIEYNLPQALSYSELLSNTTPQNDIFSNELSPEELNEQMVDNFRQAYGDHHVSLWTLAEHARADPSLFYTALEQLNNNDNPNESSSSISNTNENSFSYPSAPPSESIAQQDEYDEAEVDVANQMDGSKLYRCPTEGCTKIYKNPNGLKYHVNRGRCSTRPFHDSDKPFKCKVEGCFHSYKNANGLKYHMEHCHQEQTPNLPPPPSEPASENIVNPLLLASRFRNISPNILGILLGGDIPVDSSVILPALMRPPHIESLPSNECSSPDEDQE